MLIIQTTAALADACATLAQSDFVTVDTEFLRETTFWPELCLIQMASPDLEVIVDPMAKGLDLQPFFALMADTSVLKVFHAARQDLEIIYHLGKLIPHPIFDTQVAAMVCGFGDSISYDQLVQRTKNVQIDKSSRFTDWSRRPLSEKQLDYAMADVTHLRDVYLSLKAKLDSEGRTTWVAEEMAVLENPETYDMHPDDAWLRLKSRLRKPQELAVLKFLAAWREREARSRNVPRSRVLKTMRSSRLRSSSRRIQKRSDVCAPFRRAGSAPPQPRRSWKPSMPRLPCRRPRCHMRPNTCTRRKARSRRSNS